MTTINEFLDESDRIEKLSDEAVKDIFVRAEVFNRNKRKYMDMMSSEGFDQIMNGLKADEDGNCLYSVLRREFGIQLQAKINESDMSIEEFLWDRWTDSNRSESEKIALARQYLHNTVSGGCGMPRHDIIRGGLDAWLD
jgi:hypothetical protein